MSWLEDLVKGSLVNILKDPKIIAILEGIIAKWYEAHKPVTPPAPPLPLPIPSSGTPKEITIIDMDLVIDEAHQEGFTFSNPNSFFYVLCCHIYTDGFESWSAEGDDGIALEQQQVAIVAWMRARVVAAANELKSNPMATVVIVRGDDDGKCGSRIGPRIQRELQEFGAPMDRVQLGSIYYP